MSWGLENLLFKESKMKFCDYRSDQDKAVLDSPDFFLIRVYQKEFGWIDSTYFQADEALKRYEAIRAMNKPYRLMLVAVKNINDKVVLCSIDHKILKNFAQENLVNVLC